MIRRSVTVRVPATTANLGPGFDSVGLAVDLWNELTVELASSFSIHIEGEGADNIPRNQDNYVVKGVELAFKIADKPVPPLAYICRNGIPFGSGLGSSSAAIVSGLLAGLVLAGKELPVLGQEELLQIAAQLEGHIDNLSPCIYGGLQIGVHDGTRWNTTNVQIPKNLQLIVFVPETPMSTEEARAMLPPSIPRKDAVFNIGRTALLIHSFVTGQLDDLRIATQDALHQPIRGGPTVMPFLFPVINAALDAGAKGAFLSGAGSSVMAITTNAHGDIYTQDHRERYDGQVSAAMTAAAASTGTKGRIFVSRPSMVGAHVTNITEAPDASLGHGVKYISTRDEAGVAVTFEHAVMEGLAPDGGLYVPQSIPVVTEQQLKEWKGLRFPDLACKIMQLYIGQHEIPPGALQALLDRSYATFSSAHVTPLVDFSDDASVYLLEQFHGPTCAFKDVALQFVGNLFEFFLQRRNAADGTKDKHHITVVGATSGDTGSAAIEGLRGKKNVEVFILHPHNRVAPIQEAQMTTVLDANVHNIAVDANFDDCQTIVKTLFGDRAFREKHSLAAINSINWARILAQIVYYFYAYYRWVDAKPGRRVGDQVSFVVPTGNFGNALSGFYAKQMGLPIEQIVVATNRNDILYRFFAHADYTARDCVPSLAPAMDIVIPSNFERFLFWVAGGNPKVLSAFMKSIKDTGRFDFGPQQEECMRRVRELFTADRASDDDIRATIGRYRDQRKYLLCPHSACGLHALSGVRTEGRSYICLATAHPAKFGDSLEETRSMSPRVPPQLEGLLGKEKRCLYSAKSAESIKGIIEQALAEAAAKTVAKSTCAKSKSRDGSSISISSGGGANLAALAGAWLLGIGTAWLLAKKIGK